MTPNIYALRLSPIERGFAYAQGLIRFRPCEDQPEFAVRKSEAKLPAQYGRVRALAVEVAEGRVTGESIPAIASAYGVGSDSLRAAVWKARNERRAAS